ncbi:hypothetical protein [Leifsonia sp. EB34]|uniref:hypothetical protein n=1 Tax=Leifsonia sp. EB34 TaxID=3156303 RepID=UPI0035120A2A
MTDEDVDGWPSTTPPQVLSAASKLSGPGFTLVHRQVGPMDSGLFLYARGKREVRILADRCQWWIEDQFGSLGPFPSRINR